MRKLMTVLGLFLVGVNAVALPKPPSVIISALMEREEVKKELSRGEVVGISLQAMERDSLSDEVEISCGIENGMSRSGLVVSMTIRELAASIGMRGPAYHETVSYFYTPYSPSDLRLCE